jgi:DNA-binding NarL/FixJ family response regulator
MTAEELLQAVGAVLDGETFISQKVATNVIAALRAASVRQSMARPRALSIREEQIVRLLLQGKTNREIAGGLGLREKTIKHYMTLLMQKLDARNRVELALAVRSVEANSSIRSFN